jgi:hypothetical protein
MADETLASLGILIVEDQPLLSKQLAMQLERLGADGWWDAFHRVPSSFRKYGDLPGTRPYRILTRFTERGTGNPNA